MTDTEDPFAPKGDAQALAAAVNVAMSYLRLPLLDNHRAHVTEQVDAVARRFNEAEDRAKDAPRYADILVQLANIRAAAGALATAFAEADQATFNALHGDLRMQWHMRSDRHQSRLGPLYTIISGFPLPYGPGAPAMELREIEQNKAYLESIASRRQRVDWAVAAQALGELIRVREVSLEESFSPDLERIRSFIDEGVDGSLPISNAAERIRQSKLERKRLKLELARRGENGGKASRAAKSHNSPNHDLGGKENVVHDSEGHPKWHLARECWSVLSGDAYPANRKIAGSNSSPLMKLTRAVFEYATGLAPDEDGIRAGLDHYVRRAAIIMGAYQEHLERLIRGSQGDTAAFTEEDQKRWATLQAALQIGRVPAWLGAN